MALDDAVPPDRVVCILQHDVEYYEQQALDGALATIRRCRPFLVLENLPADPSWFAANILSLGYEKTGPAQREPCFLRSREKPERYPFRWVQAILRRARDEGNK
jgi:hypothetical protein